MKKILFCLLFSLIIGACLGFYSYKIFNRDKAVDKPFRDVYAIQIGAFEDKTNAISLAEKYGAIIVFEQNKYRVYIAICSSTLNIIKNYFDENKIPYYVRSINVSDDFYNYLSDYEIILNSASKDSYKSIITNILKKYEEDN